MKFSHKALPVYDGSVEYDIVNNVSFTPGIWKKEVLKKWLRPWESIWGFEGYGNIRYQRWKYPYIVEEVTNITVYESPVYDNSSIVRHGKWINNKRVDEFFENLCVEVDFDELGRIELEEINSMELIDVLSKYSIPEIIVKIFNRIRSFF